MNKLCLLLFKGINDLNLNFRLISLAVLIFIDSQSGSASISSYLISFAMLICGFANHFKDKGAFFLKIKTKINLIEFITIFLNLNFIVLNFYFEINCISSENQERKLFRYSAIEFFYLNLYQGSHIYSCLSLIVFSILLTYHFKGDLIMCVFVIILNMLYIFLWLKSKPKPNRKRGKEIQTSTSLQSQLIASHAATHTGGVNRITSAIQEFSSNFPDSSDLVLILDRNKELQYCNYEFKQSLNLANIDMVYFRIYFEDWKFNILEKLDEFPRHDDLYQKIFSYYHHPENKNENLNQKAVKIDDVLVDLMENKSELSFYLVSTRDKNQKERFMQIYFDNERILLKIKKNSAFEEWLEFKSQAAFLSSYMTFMEHEFRTPLNCIINILQILEDFVDPDIESSIISPALISSKLLLNSLTNFFDFGKIKTLTYEKNDVEFDLPQLLYEIIEIIKNRASCRGLTIKQEIDEKIKLVRNDPNRIRQILINLLENALSSTKKGTIILSAQIVEIDQIEISVTDTSLGFLSDDQIKIKEALDENDKKKIDVLKSQLVGFGVIISNDIAKNLKGGAQGLMFSSLFNEGSTFSFRFSGYRDLQADDCATESDRDSFIHLPFYSCKLISDVFVHNNFCSCLFSNGSQSIIQSEIKKEVVGSLQSFFCTTKKDEVTSLTKQSVCSCFSNQNTKMRRSKSSSKNSKNSKNSRNKFIFVSEALSSIEESFKITRKESFNLENEVVVVRNFIRLRPCKCPLVLIIDDNDFNILALQYQLKRLDIISEKALSADQGIEMIKEMTSNECCNTFKIIFLDIEMPIKNGFQAFEEIKCFYEHFKLNNLCVVAVTAHGQNSEIVKDIRKTGIKDVMSKPLSIESLIFLLLNLHKHLVLQ